MAGRSNYNILRLLGLAAAAWTPTTAPSENTFVLKGEGIRAREDGLKAASEGRFAEAVPLLQRASRNPPMRTDAESLSAAETVNALGGAHKELGQLDEAVAAFDRAIGILEGLGAVGARDLAVVINNLGSVRADAGRSTEAEALYERALRVVATQKAGTVGSHDDEDDEDDDDDDDAGGGRDDLISADAYNNLADLRHGAGRLDEARSLHARALRLRERVLGSEHGELAGSLNNVAVLLMDLQRQEEALPVSRRAARLSQAGAGKAHPQHATALGNLGSVLMQLGRPAEARPHLKRALTIHRKALGKEHERTKAAASSLKACAATVGATGTSATSTDDGEGRAAAAAAEKEEKEEKSSADVSHRKSRDSRG
jgi:tetratricopeptide (TPR) repeat protein